MCVCIQMGCGKRDRVAGKKSREQKREDCYVYREVAGDAVQRILVSSSMQLQNGFEHSIRLL